MAELIYVEVTGLHDDPRNELADVQAVGRVALWDRDPRHRAAGHEKGEVFLAGKGTRERVALTEMVQGQLDGGFLKRVEGPAEAKAGK